MILIFLIALLHIAAGFIIARRWFLPKNRTEWLLGAGLCAYVTFYVIPINLGWLTGYMNGYTIGAGLVTAWGCAGALLWSRFKKNWTPEKWDKPLIKGRAKVEFLIWLITATVLITLLVAGSVLPVRSWDAPSYHMNNAISWHSTGRFVLDSFGSVGLSAQAVSAECAPNVKAVWPFLVLLFTKDSPGTALTQFPFFLLLLVTVRAIALQINCRSWVASLVVLCVTTIPELFLQSIEAYADVVFLCGEMVLIWSIIRLWQTQCLTWRSLIYFPLGLGILAGAKSASVVTGAALAGFYLMLLFAKLRRDSRSVFPGYAGSVICLIVFAVAVTGGPWMLHSWQKFQNPVFPFEIKVGNHLIFPGKFSPDINNGMIEQFTGAKGKTAIWNTFKELWRPPSLSNWAGGLGATMFVIGFPALALFVLWGLWDKPGTAHRRILFFCFLLLLATCPTIASSRFSLFAPVIAILCAGWLISVFLPAISWIAAIGLIAVAGYDLYMVASAIQFRQQPPEMVAFNLLSGYPDGAARDIFPDQYTALDYWREEISKPGLKMGLPPTSISVWYAYAPWSPATMERMRDPGSSRDAITWHNELTSHGITHYYARKEDPGFDIALSHPKLFRLLIRRLDCQYGMMGDFAVEPWPEDALFEVRNGNSK